MGEYYIRLDSILEIGCVCVWLSSRYLYVCGSKSAPVAFCFEHDTNCRVA
jgi:hypothetical protein